MRKRKAMVAWFNPLQLIQTAIRVLISTVFGQFADRREAFAAANRIRDDKLDACFDYSGKGDADGFWFDYVADTGDGWNPTYAVARLLAREGLRPANAEGGPELERYLPRGRVLLMGGDQVYPTASRDEYEDRLRYPFDEAFKEEGRWSDGDRPDLYAVPGNHDWYDGLRTFSHIFCRRTIKAEGEAEVDRPGKVFGGRQTHQTRSYFALKLPHGWWLWGTDSQLEGYIDQPQVDFFQFVAEKWMDPGSKLILCTGTPDWEYVRADHPERFDTLSYLERLAPAVANKGHRLRLVLSGDSHHYARFYEDDLNYITCGGGGAFLHPTHQLPKKPIEFDSKFPKPGRTRVGEQRYPRKLTIGTKAGTEEEALFPDRGASSRLTAGNLLFALRNWHLTLAYVGIYVFFTWLLDFNSRVDARASLVDALGGKGLCEAMLQYWLLVAVSPWSVLLCGLAWGAYYYFADIENGLVRGIVGAAHGVAHALVVTLVTCATIQGLVGIGLEGSALCILAAAVLSAVASATLIGLYLWFALAAFGGHWGHFSSLRVEGYKSFLRLWIDPDGKLHIYPIGLTRVPGDSGQRSGPAPELNPHLIERLEPIS